MPSPNVADDKLDREPLVPQEHNDTDHTLALAQAQTSLRSARRLAFLFAGLVPLTCFLVWCSHHVPPGRGAMVLGVNDELKDASGRYGTCDVAKFRPVKAPHENVWRNLDIDEAKDIRSWLFNKEQGLNLTTNVLSGPKWVWWWWWWRLNV
jgi:hypothetical protein